MGKVCTFPKAVPEHFFEVQAVCQIALGEAHTLALTVQGSLYAFGWNEFGQLGVGSQTVNNTFKVHRVPFEGRRVR